jgi:hypothetical protein
MSSNSNFSLKTCWSTQSAVSPTSAVHFRACSTIFGSLLIARTSKLFKPSRSSGTMALKAPCGLGWPPKLIERSYTRGCEGEESWVSDACRPRIAGAAEEVTGRRQAQARRQKHDPLGMLSHVSTRSNRFRIRQRDHAGDNEGAEARAEDELARDKNTIVIQQGLDHWRSGRLWLLGSAPSNAFRGGMFRVLPTKPFAGCRQSMQSR